MDSGTATAHADALATAFAAALRACGGVPAPQAERPMLAVFCDLHAWRPWRAGAWAWLDDGARARVERLREAGDRDERALAYALHRLLAAAWLDRPVADVLPGRDGEGRPHVLGAPDAFCTSISRPRGCAALLVGERGPAGIDLEPLSHAGIMEEIAGLALHPDERARLEPLQGPARARTLLETWVRKEAYLKAEGVGLQRAPAGFAAPADSVLPTARSRAGLVLRMLDAGPRHVAAVAVPPGVRVQSSWLSPPASP